MKKNIKSQIQSGYKSLIILIVVIVLTTGFYLFNINSTRKAASEQRNHQSDTQRAIIAHSEWILGLTEHMLGGKAFTGGIDPTKCVFGVWLSGLSDAELKEPGVYDLIETIKVPHAKIHNVVTSVLEVNKTSQKEAFAIYSKEIGPNIGKVIGSLNQLNAGYATEAIRLENLVSTLLQRLIITLFVLTVFAIIFSLWFGNRTAKKIAKPITAVVDWSKKLALGVDDLDFDNESLGITDSDEETDNEIAIMVDSFKKMADSIKENVNVVRKVADGDMTAFVNIRSREDSLGKNLYKMVQTNDMMFAEILDVATAVAGGSDQISRASHELADSTNAQAAAVEEISGIIGNIALSIVESGKNANAATEISDRIKEDVKYSNEKMDLLVRSVDEIREASERVSMVIKSIDDIAFQTNILALNAAIEAARAGEAGKGFAVVASEVRELALKSSNAADESKLLIENTIDKTNQGSKISTEASATYAEIVTRVNDLLILIVEIARSSAEQDESVKQVNAGMQMVAMAASSNAAATEQSASASSQMNVNAEHLKAAMSKFNLRKRQQGKPYIPPEKTGDKAFIEQAYKNYSQSKITGKSTLQ